jgi:hypothetical protein
MTVMIRLQDYEGVENKAMGSAKEKSHHYIASEACNALSSASSCSSAV